MVCSCSNMDDSLDKEAAGGQRGVLKSLDDFSPELSMLTVSPAKDDAILCEAEDMVGPAGDLDKAFGS
jgi:hypothetical protein